MAKCTKCSKWSCHSGDLEDLPTEGFCPMLEQQAALAKARSLYEEPDTRKISQEAARVEAIGYCQWSRVEETMEFAKRIGAKKLGVAYCIGLKREAAIVARIYEENGFDVAAVCCKTGSIPKEEIGLADGEKIRPGTYEAVCNPIGQAEVLNAEETDLNIIVGLCVGHDSLFIRQSKALVTYLIAKDRVLAHNPAGALYTSQSYYRKKVFERNST